MKIEPSQHDTIFAQLRKKRKWTGRRNGHRVRLWTRPSPAGVQICYQVTKRHLAVSGHAYAVARAIEHVNEVLEPGQVRIAQPEAMPLTAAPRRQEWLPYKDGEL